MADGKGEVIHNTCPCCEVPRPPHCDDCTFAVDCPEACADFDYVANLRLTDAERAFLELHAHRLVGWSRSSDESKKELVTVRGLLERMG